MTGKSKPSMEGEELVAAAAAPVHGHAQQQHQSKVMRTDKFPVRVPPGPTLGPDQSSSTSVRPSGAATDSYLYGGAPAPATSPATPATPTTPTTTSTPTITTSPIAAAAAALQPFPSPASPFPATFESPGMAAATAAAATFRFPFTTAQWQELERQAMIYKYMMAAVPIPPDLLLPSKSCYHDSSPPRTAVFVVSVATGLHDIGWLTNMVCFFGSGEGVDVQLEVLEHRRPGAGEVPADGREEVAVLPGCGAGPEVLRTPHAPGPPSFKKACGSTK